jgi:hypothetical protein
MCAALSFSLVITARFVLFHPTAFGLQFSMPMKWKKGREVSVLLGSQRFPLAGSYVGIYMAYLGGKISGERNLTNSILRVCLVEISGKSAFTKRGFWRCRLKNLERGNFYRGGVGATLGGGANTTYNTMSGLLGMSHYNC